MIKEVFFQKIGSIMRDNQYDREVGGYRSGKLTKRGIYKVMTNSTRVFTRKTERKNKKYNVIMLIDESGSMINGLNNGRYVADQYVMMNYYRSNPVEVFSTENCLACDGPHKEMTPNEYYSYGIPNHKGVVNDHPTRLEACAELASILSQGLLKHKLFFALIGFSNYNTVHKGLTEGLTLQPYQVRNKILAEADWGGTNMASGISEAIKILKNSDPDTVNITVIFTDGSPDETNRTRSRLKELEKYSIVLPIGIGQGVESAMRNTFQDLKYPYSIVTTRNEFMDTVLKQLSNHITRN